MIGFLLAALAATAAAMPLPPAPTLPTGADPGAVSVLAFGAAGDGKTDDTAAFQAALDSVGQAGGGVVLAPAGQYLLGGGVSLPQGVALVGSYQSVPSHAMAQGAAAPSDGTVLLATGGRGDAEGTPLVTMTANTVVRGVCVYYPEQSAVETPVAYPWTFSLSGNNIAVVDVEMLNPYQGIYAVQAHRHYIARVQGQPLYRGLFVDETYDIGRVYDVHFNPWWSTNMNVTGWMAKNNVAFTFARSDWEYVEGTFCFLANIGYKFVQSSTGSMNGVLVNIGADLSFNASVYVEAAQPAGLLISTGEFTAFNDAGWCDSCQDFQPRQVVAQNAGTDFQGPLRFVNSAFWGPNYQTALVDYPGTVGFSDCTFVQWTGGDDVPALEAVSGNLIVKGSEFQQPGVQVRLHEGVAKAVVVGNVFAGAESVDNQSKGSVQVGLNAADSD